MRRPNQEQQGSALIVAVVVMFMLGVLATVVASTSVTRSRVAVESRFRTQAMSAAEAGIALQINEIVNTNGASLGTTGNDPDDDGQFTITYDLGDGQSVTVDVADLGRDGVNNDGVGGIDDGDELGVVRVRSQGAAPLSVGGGQIARRIEVFLATSLHSLFYKATYVGNSSNDPTYQVAFGAAGTDAAPGAVSPMSNWDTTGKSTDADYIEGDIYVKGLTGLKGGTAVHGDVDAAGSTGAVTGSPVDGYTTTDNATEIAPPDLNAQNYDTIADLIVSDVNGDGVLEFSGPEAGTGVEAAFHGAFSNSNSYKQTGISDNFGTHDAPYIHLGNSSGNIAMPDSMSGKLILIRGNVWIHETTTFELSLPSGGNVQTTLVVEGNLYVADDLNYNNNDNALLFMTKAPAGQESYNDVNGNHTFDPGVDTILNDTGVIGTYEGRAEGAGNIYFGDPRYGTGGVSDGYMYAQNNVYLTALNPAVNISGFSSGQDAIYGTYGFLSAGNHMYLGDPRTAGSDYVNFRVKYDDRLETGAVSFKGAPGPFGGGFEGLQVLSWQEIAPQ